MFGPYQSANSVGIGTNAPSKLLDISGNNSSIVIHSTAQNQDSTLFFSTPFNSSSVAKTSIIAEGANTWNRSDLHFCLNNDTNHTTEVSLSDAKMTILYNTGYVGINETSPDAFLHINWTKDSNGLKEMIKLSWDDAGAQDTLANDGTKISFYTSSVNNNPGSVESAYIGAARVSGSEASHDTKLVFATKENSGSSLTEKMVINNNGQISLGEGGIDSTDSVIIRGFTDKIGLEIYTPSTSTTFDVLQIVSDVGGTKNVNATIDCDGDMSNSNGTYGNFSDVRLKENIVDCNSQWDDIKNFRFVNYNLINTPEQPQLGVIAQEIELVSSGLVKTTNNTKEVNGEIIENIKIVKTSIMYMKGLKALQETILRIETLEKAMLKIETLQEAMLRIETLEKEVNLLKNN